MTSFIYCHLLIHHVQEFVGMLDKDQPIETVVEPFPLSPHKLSFFEIALLLCSIRARAALDGEDHERK